MSGSNDLGQLGEQLAKDYLNSLGYELLEERWRYNKAEIDLIYKDGAALVFIEVKTRSSAYFGQPEEFVNDKKKKLMTMAASAYMRKINHDWEIRFDIVSIMVLPNADNNIQHFKDAFFLGL